MAALLRFWQLGELPPGLYRDEAYNGLDALEVLQGNRPLFFTANNGREPAYIYLTALSLSLLGRSPLAVRLGAAVIGTLTTWLTYRLAAVWFGRRAGLLSAWMWAVTLWPVHLSRIGLRPIMMVPILAAAFWLGTRAYQERDKPWLWFLAGLVYGASFYTYLAVRFTPLLLLLLGGYLLWRGLLRPVWRGVIWFGLGAFLTLLPLTLMVMNQPDILFGRAGQVSILSETINGGDLWGTLWRHLTQAAGMFLWRGDQILRHNPAGRPLFDIFMAVPFLAGLIWSLRQWRQPAAMALLLWMAIMLGPTILAEDTPHFLRAVGLLPAVLMLPAIGLSLLWQWQAVPANARRGLVLLLVAATTVKTAVDYQNYGSQQEVAYLFEQAAVDMAEKIAAEPLATSVLVDERLWSGWSSIPFIAGERPIARFQAEEGVLVQPELPVALYVWPYGPLDFIPQALPEASLISVTPGELARGDLDEQAALLNLRYTAERQPAYERTAANFGDQLLLRDAQVTTAEDGRLVVSLVWQPDRQIASDLVVFVHLLDESGMKVAQDDAPVAGGYWPRQWWQPGQMIRDLHQIELTQPYDPSRNQILIGIYDAYTQVRLPVVDPSGNAAADVWLLEN